MRYFCAAADSYYEQARLALDAAWGHPNSVTKTKTCIDCANDAPRNSEGMIVLAVNDSFCEFDAANAMLSIMLASGAASEITQAEYMAAIARRIA